MTPTDALVLVDRLADRYGHTLRPEARELYADTFEAFPRPIGAVTVDLLTARFAGWPDLATVTAALEHEATAWVHPAPPEEQPATPSVARAHLASARRALGQS